MITVYVGLGSNVGERLDNLRAAVAALHDSNAIEVVRASAVYDTDPVGPAQPTFLNAVIEIRTSLRPHPLLARLQAIEREVGRVQRERWGPREIDLDLLLYGEEVVSEPGLRVPHASMTQRAFVLVPLADLAPFARVPGAGRVVEHLDEVDGRGVRRAYGPDALWP